MPNYSLQFDGVNDYVSIADSGLFDSPTTALTVECFVKITNRANNLFPAFIKKDGQWILRLNNGKLNGIVWLSVSGLITISDSTNITENTWLHCALTYDGSNTNLYLNGSRVAQSGAVSGNVVGSANVVGIGAAGAGSEPTAGYIDEMRISSSVRYSGATYAVPTSKFTIDANTVALWHFDDGTGSTLTDSSSNALNGTLGSSTAAPTWSSDAANLSGYGSSSWNIFSDDSLIF